MSLWIENLLQTLSEALAVCSKLDGHRGNWLGRPREHQAACQCSGWTHSLHLTTLLSGPKQTCITPHPENLRALSGWDIPVAIQMWSMFWFYAGKLMIWQVENLCLFFLRGKKKNILAGKILTVFSSRILDLHTGESES